MRVLFCVANTCDCEVCQLRVAWNLIYFLVGVRSCYPMCNHLTEDPKLVHRILGSYFWSELIVLHSSSFYSPAPNSVVCFLTLPILGPASFSPMFHGVPDQSPPNAGGESAGVNTYMSEIGDEARVLRASGEEPANRARRLGAPFFSRVGRAWGRSVCRGSWKLGFQKCFFSFFSCDLSDGHGWKQKRVGGMGV